MKKISIIIITVLSLTSCSDFLNILPLNDVVLENYWTQKSDVTSVVNSCYQSLETADCIKRMSAWGEMRSDNIIAGSSTPYTETELLKENILPNSSYCTWTAFYQTINRCNTVCHYAPQVQAKDPNYTENAMKANIAEASAIRDLCYFYLIRAFRDVPYTTQPSIDDTEDYTLPASSFNSILDSLITDLESVKDNAVKRYYTDDSDMSYYNTSRITRYAIYAMLADMYLWKQDYDNCIKYCDLIIDYKKSQYKEQKAKVGEDFDVSLYNDYPLINEKENGDVKSGHAYNEIFGTGNSFESIFELYFENNQSVTNSFIESYYGSSSTTNGYLSAPSFLYTDVFTGSNSIFKKTDCRVVENIQSSSSKYAITKYVRQNVSFNNSNTSSTTAPTVTSSARSTAYANWIIYRLSDVMLMKAEAEVEKVGNASLDSNTNTDLYKNAFALVNAVNKRANNITTASQTDTLVYSNYKSSRTAMENLILLERQRELMFEGKRWFDLVRTARRDGNNSRLVTLVLNKYEDNINAIKIKLSAPDILYFPYSESELKVNPNLTQNPAYNTGDDTEQNY
jgi:starch-binding outer membrane protein, SusD/RagB family